VTVLCEDGNACTANDVCVNGTCKGGAAPSCDDGNPCTTDSCDTVKGCQHPALPYGTTCGGPQICWSGVCGGVGCSYPSGSVAIPDNNPVGISSELVIPDKGVTDAVAVVIDLKNTDISAVEVFLYDPTGVQYVLYSKSGKKGESLKVTYPDPTKPVSGNLAGWAGKNPAGAWRIRVVDKAFLNNTVDGTVTWSVRTRTAGCP
jgi:hypothetical protein